MYLWSGLYPRSRPDYAKTKYLKRYKVLSKKTFECSFKDTLIVNNYYSPFFHVLLVNVANNVNT